MIERVLIVGGGGREHALAQAIAHDVSVLVIARNRNPALEKLADSYLCCDETDPSILTAFATDHTVDVALIGPEPPLDSGVADRLRDAGVVVFGPRQQYAKLETDKVFQREFMLNNGIPAIPKLNVFHTMELACEYLDTATGKTVIKPAQHGGGKTVGILHEDFGIEGAKDHIQNSPSSAFVFEEYLEGAPFSLSCVVIDGNVVPLCMTRDHKRAFEEERGPNTGGMGTYSGAGKLLPYLDQHHYTTAIRVLEATVDEMPGYTGALVGQFIHTSDGIRIIDYNVRFGDTEIIDILLSLDTDLLSILEATTRESSVPELELNSKATVCRYIAPPGYPSDPQPDVNISIPPKMQRQATTPALTQTQSHVYYGRVNGTVDQVTTTTSRTLAICASGKNIPDAGQRVTDILKAINFLPLHVRKDIGHPRSLRRHAAAATFDETG